MKQMSQRETMQLPQPILIDPRTGLMSNDGCIARWVVRFGEGLLACRPSDAGYANAITDKRGFSNCVLRRKALPQIVVQY